ncbi:MAG: high frequency lysogenization protein HflD [Desulfobulbaceae bacterium]|nr:high frequency lysogenization protein HflD [Desulfobulbaceae bacterium]
MEADLMLYIGAMTLGALHAFEPGHGKTLIAAYMIGTKGRAIDGMLLGMIVTFTHTFSVLLLGIVAKVLSKTYSEEQLHGWLGLFSALLILAVGIWMLRQRLKKSGGHVHLHLFGKAHSHDHHDHDHHDHDHHHTHDDLSHHNDDHLHEDNHSHGQIVASKPVHAPHKPGKLGLLVLGISGGLVPCPAAIATLLAAIAAGRIAQGLTLVIFFSLGLGLVMMTIGVVLSQASKLTEKIGSSENFSRRMGILSALIITVIGTVTLFHSVKTLWF